MIIGDALQELLRLPGARYSCVADPVTGQMIGEPVGDPSVVPTVLLAWGGGAARYLAEIEADELDDLIVTSRHSYHLVRQVGTVVSGGLLIYLCLDRARGNLAVARRELGSARLHERIAAGSHLGTRPAQSSAKPSLPAASPVRAPVRTSGRAAPPAALPSAMSAVAPAAPPAPTPSGSSPSGAVSVLGANPVAAVPWPRTAPTTLPRRAAAPLPPARSAPESEASSTPPPGLPGSGVPWANDVPVLRRLLAALRRMT
jgi:hypothetical protein